MYRLSSAQSNALIRMEEFLQLPTHRDVFSSDEDFQKYWDYLDSLCKKHRKNGRSSYVYTDATSLIKKGRRYIARYKPSSFQLERYLLGKTHFNSRLVSSVLPELLVYISDTSVALSRCENYYFRGKTRHEISKGLSCAGFSSETIEESMALFYSDKEIIDRISFESRVGSYIQQHRSRQWIEKLIRCNSDVVQSILNVLFSDISPDVAALTLIDRFRSQGVSDERILQRLLRRGFGYGDVYRLVFNKK